jgi:hypothetical protein
MGTHASRKGISLLIVLGIIATAGCKETEQASSAFGSPPGADSSNNPPQISGSPASQVLVGNNYSFTPTASDTDGDNLSFSVQNAPGWTQFDSATGRLAGMASQGTEGTYSDIRISVSDGSASASLPQFSIQVTQAALGAVTLSWAAPVTNQDGTPLTDLSSYTIYYGPESGNYTEAVDINNAGTTTYVLENLVPDTYYFAITASNDAGVESGYSDEAVHRIN